MEVHTNDFDWEIRKELGEATGVNEYSSDDVYWGFYHSDWGLGCNDTGWYFRKRGDGQDTVRVTGREEPGEVRIYAVDETAYEEAMDSIERITSRLL